MALTARQQRFVDEMLVDANATQSAIRAGFSTKTAKQQGARLLTNVDVAAAIAERQAKRLNKLEVKAERVVSEMAAGAFYDAADLVAQAITCPADIAKLPEQVRRAIVGWSWDRRGNFVLKLADKSRALDMLARHLGMYRDQIELKIGLGDWVAKSFEPKPAENDRSVGQQPADGGRS